MSRLNLTKKDKIVIKVWIVVILLSSLFMVVCSLFFRFNQYTFLEDWSWTYKKSYVFDFPISQVRDTIRSYDKDKFMLDAGMMDKKERNKLRLTVDSSYFPHSDKENNLILQKEFLSSIFTEWPGRKCLVDYEFLVKLDSLEPQKTLVRILPIKGELKYGLHLSSSESGWFEKRTTPIGSTKVDEYELLYYWGQRLGQDSMEVFEFPQVKTENALKEMKQGVKELIFGKKENPV